MVCIHRKRDMMHQYGINFVPYIYVLVSTFHHNNSKVLVCDALSFLWGRHFGPPRFVSEKS
jgi:hypothetical protein